MNVTIDKVYSIKPLSSVSWAAINLSDSGLILRIRWSFDPLRIVLAWAAVETGGIKDFPIAPCIYASQTQHNAYHKLDAG